MVDSNRSGTRTADFSPVLSECGAKASEAVPEHNARRLFHGRGRHFPGYEGLTVDQFGTCLLVGCFDDDADDARTLAGLLFERIDHLSGVCVQHRQGRKTQTEVICGAVPEELVVTENSLKYLVQPLRNQNVGLFLDMAPTRAWIAGQSQARRVLNLFSFTCAFSIAALSGGALHVVNNDMSRQALDWGQRNHQLNAQDLRRVSMLPHNLFKSWWKIKQLGPYDLVIVDPPTNQRGSFVAEKQYSQVLKRLPEFCAPGADIVACLNSPFLNGDFLTGQMARWCSGVRFVEFMPASKDFPDEFPDRGLKVARFRYPA